MIRGVVMELTDERTALVLTPEFTFVRVLRQANMVIGAEVEDVYPLAKQVSIVQRLRMISMRRRFMATGIAVASLLVAAVLVFSQVIPVQAAPYLYLSLDVNPSVEFTVSQAEHVIAVKGLDQDGVAVVRQLHLKGEPLSVAVGKYMQKLTHLGYVNNQSRVVITVAAAEVSAVSALGTTLSNVRKDIAGTLAPTKIPLVSFVVTKSFFNQAVHDKMSPGRLALYVEAKRIGQPVSWKKIMQGHMAQAVGGPTPLQGLLNMLKNNPELPVNSPPLPSAIDHETFLPHTLKPSTDKGQHSHDNHPHGGRSSNHTGTDVERTLSHLPTDPIAKTVGISIQHTLQVVPKVAQGVLGSLSAQHTDPSKVTGDRGKAKIDSGRQ